MEPPSEKVPATIAIKSFTKVVGKTRSVNIPLKTPGSHRGEPAMFFSEKDIETLSSLFNSPLLVNSLTVDLRCGD